MWSWDHKESPRHGFTIEKNERRMKDEQKMRNVIYLWPMANGQDHQHGSCFCIRSGKNEKEKFMFEIVHTYYNINCESVCVPVPIDSLLMSHRCVISFCISFSSYLYALSFPVLWCFLLTWIAAASNHLKIRSFHQYSSSSQREQNKLNELCCTLQNWNQASKEKYKIEQSTANWFKRLVLRNDNL